MTTYRLDASPSFLEEQSATRPRPAQPSPARSAPSVRPAQVLACVDVIHALCDLDRVDRAALRLIYWHGRTQAQVADELHLPIGTVRAAIARGRRQLTDRLTEH